MSIPLRDKSCIFVGFSSSISEEAKRQHDLFTAEQRRQRESVGRIEKIEVTYENASNIYDSADKTTLVMNKNISTPYDCAKRKFFFLYTITGYPRTDLQLSSRQVRFTTLKMQ